MKFFDDNTPPDPERRAVIQGVFIGLTIVGIFIACAYWWSLQ